MDAIIKKSDVNVAQVIEKYLEEVESLQPVGRTKRFTLAAIARPASGQVKVEDVTSQVFVEYVQEYFKVDGVQVQAVFSVAKPACGATT